MSVREFIKAMPKIELHLHLEGSVQPETLLELATQNQISLPASDIAGLRSWYTFRDFDHFIDIYRQICGCLQTPDDFSRITMELGRTMAEQNIRYAEVTWTPASHVNETLSFDALLAGINAGRDYAERTWGVRMNWIPDISRCVPESAGAVVEWITRSRSNNTGIVALGLGGPEVGWPPEMYEDSFRTALAAELHSNPHAGETVGPASVWGAIRALKAERIGHGVRSVEDPALVNYLIEHQIHLEVNPTSNLCLSVYPTYSEHPLRALVEAGANVSVNSDDPALFNTTLTDEYLHAVEDCGLSIEQLEQTVFNAIKASYLTETEKSTMQAEFRAEIDQLRAQYNV